MIKGQLFLCSLPIGNRQDITLRVLQALRDAKYIYAEDTRSIRVVMAQNNISLNGKNILSYHDKSSSKELDKIIRILNEGSDIYYFSDAGSPVVSDPAFPLVRLAYDNQISINSLPGPCSIISAIELAAVPTIPFSFCGFLPREASKIEKLLDEMRVISGTFVCFESPRRIASLVSLLRNRISDHSFPDMVCFIREITKKNQQVIRLNKFSFESGIDELIELGEFVIIFYYERVNKKSLKNPELKRYCQEMLEQGVSRKKLSKLFAEITGESAKSVYQDLKIK